MKELLFLATPVLLALCVARWLLVSRRSRERVEEEDVLKRLFVLGQSGLHVHLNEVAGATGFTPEQTMKILKRLQAGEKVSCAGLALTDSGEKDAKKLLRAHRLMERYLADEAHMPLPLIHQAAEVAEHYMTPDQIDDLDDRLGHPQFDPHGDPIPSEDGSVPVLKGVSLVQWPINRSARVTHVEDEPAVAFQAIAALDIRPESFLRVLETHPDRIVLEVGGRVCELAPILASNIQVADMEHSNEKNWGISLADIKEGQEMEIEEIAPSCQGYTRRRMLDLGLTRGAHVRLALSGWADATRAYEVRGTLVSLRKEQAAQILGRHISRRGK